MARLITKFKYLNGKQGKVGGYATYIATREGVDKIDSSFLFGNHTKKQEELIQKILRDFPDSRDMHEYEDYIHTPTKRNASEFISRAMEDNAGQAMDKKTYADYIATRPRAERFGSHGLFTDDGVEVKLSAVSKELNEYDGNVWTVIISLRREDAERLGYNTGRRWRDMLRSQTDNLSKNFKIPMENLQWYAAFHNESHHPHVHLMVYSKNPKEGYLTEMGVHNLRSAFATDIFVQDLLCVYEEQTSNRDELKKISKERVDEMIRALQEAGAKNEVIGQKLMLLSKRLANTKGKKVYGYLKEDVKALVRSIVDELEKDERIKELYDLWYEKKEQVIQTYTSELPPRIPLSENKEFKSIRNAVIQAAMGLLIDTEEEAPLPVKEPKDGEVEKKYRKGSRKTMWELYAWGKALLDKEGGEYNPERARDVLKESALRGNHVAKYKLGKMYLTGEEIKQDIAEGLRWLKESADEGNEYAQYLLGKTLVNGKQVKPNLQQGEELLRSAAEKGNKYAAYTFGKLMREGKISKRENGEDIKFIRQAAEKGFEPATYLYGKLLYQGEEVERDVHKALEYLGKVEKSNQNAVYWLGKIFLTDEEVKDIGKGIYYTEKAARGGNHYAMCRLGKLYLYGKDVERDRELAMKCLTMAAEQGNGQAKEIIADVKAWEEKTRKENMVLGTMRLFLSIGRIFYNRLGLNHWDKRIRTDKKEQERINEKKRAQGLKQG